MNYSDIKYYDTQNGKKIRHSLFVSGCSHHCKGCFNADTWDFNYGDPFTEDKQFEFLNQFKLDDNDNREIDGVSILGGEPLDSTKGVFNLLTEFKDLFPTKTVWLWSGYTFEEILSDTSKLELLKLCDILVDGRFVEAKKDLNLKFRGSSNQRIIDVQKSLNQNKVILYDI